MNIKEYFIDTYESLAEFSPNILTAVVILLAAYIIGRLISLAITTIINKTSLGKKSQEGGQDLGSVLGKAFFWITILIALPAILSPLGLERLLEPLQSITDTFLGYLPNVFGAGLIFGVGFAIATVLKRALTGILQAAQADKLAEKSGLTNLTGKSSISQFVGTLAFVLIIIPVSIAALDALDVAAISVPAKEMLSSFLNAIPNIFAGAIVLVISYVIARFASNTLSSLLPTLGFDAVGEKIGLTSEITGDVSLSKVAAFIAFAAILISGFIEATTLLNFTIISSMLSEIISLGGRIILGTVIIGFGIIAADVVSTILSKSKSSKGVASFVKVAIILLATAMGLRQMGVANEIINMGFTLILGAVALGSAIAIGIGGKETAHRLLEKWTKDV